jgi:hypothetical protein
VQNAQFSSSISSGRHLVLKICSAYRGFLISWLILRTL